MRKVDYNGYVAVLKAWLASKRGEDNIPKIAKRFGLTEYYVRKIAIGDLAPPPTEPWKCPECGRTWNQPLCPACEISQSQRAIENYTPGDMGIDLEPKEYERYLEVRRAREASGETTLESHQKFAFAFSTHKGMYR